MLTSCNGGGSKDAVLSQGASSYKEVTIGKQIWMSENLDVDNFRNGDLIFHAQTTNEWIKAGETGQSAWCYFDNDLDNGIRYGKLYNWYAVNDPRGLAPDGWKVPSNEDWSLLIDFIGGESIAGKKMKFTDFWADDIDSVSGNGTNESDFRALPGGERCFNGKFISKGSVGVWWSSSSKSETFAWKVVMFNFKANVTRSFEDKVSGYSVRCVKM